MNTKMTYADDLSSPASLLSPAVEELLTLVGLACYQPKLQSIAARLAEDRDAAVQDLVVLDKTIPGLGLHNVNERTASGGLTGVYSIQDRPIFRGIQYVGMYLSLSQTEWLSRKIVTDSCYHVESSLKRRLNVSGNLSVGMILKRRGKVLHHSLTDILWQLNNAIYNNAKHTVEAIDFDSHMFSIVDAIAIYVVCRKVGVRLLKDLGIATKYGDPVFDKEMRVESKQHTT